MKEHLVFWVFCSLVGSSLAEGPLSIRRVNFWSTNFENIFTWESSGETAPGTTYYVQYKRYGEEWQDKSECQNITRRSCNLTRETENFTERFHARVRAVAQNCCASEWVQSPRFYPREATTIGEPEVKCIASTQSIKFFIQPPYTPLKDEDNHTLTVVDIFSQFGDVTYEIMMFCQKTQQKWIKIVSTQEFEISDLNPDTEYNGTVRIKYADKISRPYVFRVRTSPDLSWLPYLFIVILFMIILLFGAICYLIYKYIKQYDAEQPMALDFKNISRFQPLVPKAEHFLIPSGLSKYVEQAPELHPTTAMNQHLLGVLEDQKLISPTETAYQQQAKAPPFQTFAQPVVEANDLPRGYAPEATKANPPPSLDNNPLTLMYGICVEGTSCLDKGALSPNQTLKCGSSPEVFVGNGQYQAQKPEHNRQGAWVNQAQQEPDFAANQVRKTQCLSLQEETQQVSTQLLEEEKALDTGSYRKQPGELLPPALELTQNGFLESNPLLSERPPSLISHGPHGNLCQDHNTKPWTAWHPSAWTDNHWGSLGSPMADGVAPASKGLTTGPEPFGTIQGTSAPNNGLFTELFKDLELKVQWDQGTDECSTVC